MPTISKLYPQYQRINKRKGAKVRKVCKVIRFIPQTESIGNKVAVDKAPARVNGLYELLESKVLLYKLYKRGGQKIFAPLLFFLQV
ncbi:hypothetical protein CE91St24_29400 [Odoribacteraceae bacterium]|nr:hypothetical protein CE91St21_06640 [Odoribacteraceae bacterium]GKH92168.1 hypothetical protein CE91St23_06640 [Odoribacteraceae bacterium]GKH96786.1 hypothetical protein CE91St22_06640 [Odoribacteraceae bacterium]GKI03665.1 hypothetical protein CE91St24_29400 [Odoribacteraceae bacterium]